MASNNQIHRSKKSSPRLGFWWRAWIVCTALTAGAMLAFATYQGAWSRLGPLAVLALAFSYSAVALVLGLSIRWIIKGIAR